MLAFEDRVEDESGNVCYFKTFGSMSKACEALGSLIECRGCVDCEYCDRCVDCVECRECRDCRDCKSSWSLEKCVNVNYSMYCLEAKNCETCRYVRHSEGLENSIYDYTDKELKTFGLGDIPKIEDIHKKLYEAVSECGALCMALWHCGTTHCRAGWVTTLAGEAGAALEQETGTAFAAMLIYKASGYNINPKRFFGSDVVALANMKELAEV